MSPSPATGAAVTTCNGLFSGGLPPRRGIHGNSQRIMQDKNKLHIADFILQWMDERVKEQEEEVRSRYPSS